VVVHFTITVVTISKRYTLWYFYHGILPWYNVVTRLYYVLRLCIV